MEMREIKCDACPRVCPEDYQRMVEKCSAVCKARDDLNALYRKELDKHRWIPVTDRMPDTRDGDYVLVCAAEKHDKIDYRNAVTMAFVDDEGFVDVEYDFVLTGVTHWMPLPDAPEVHHA